MLSLWAPSGPTPHFSLPVPSPRCPPRGLQLHLLGTSTNDGKACDCESSGRQGDGSRSILEGRFASSPASGDRMRRSAGRERRASVLPAPGCPPGTAHPPRASFMARADKEVVCA